MRFRVNECLCARQRLLLLAALLPGGLCAQQAIINMPSADITPRGKHFVMHETQTRLRQPGRYWYGTNFYCYGVGNSTELAVTSYNVGLPATSNAATGIGFKSSPQLLRESHPEREVKITVGQMMVLNHRGKGLGSFSYAHGSLRLPGANTRVTLGGFGGTAELFQRNTGGVLGGIEQPLGKRWILLTEWFSGRHDFGFVIPGVLFHPTKSQIVVVGYKIPNTPANGKAGLVVEYGLTF